MRSHDAGPGVHADALDRFIGRLVRGWRIAGGLSQTHVAQRVGVSYQQIQKYENGASTISVPKLIAVADALRVPPSKLLEDFVQSDIDPELLLHVSPAAVLASADTRRLARAFNRIESSAIRQKLVALVESLAFTENPE